MSGTWLAPGAAQTDASLQSPLNLLGRYESMHPKTVANIARAYFKKSHFRINSKQKASESSDVEKTIYSNVISIPYDCVTQKEIFSKMSKLFIFSSPHPILLYRGD